MSGILTTVLFCPEDLLVLKAGAAARRRFLDQALCQLRPRYEAALTEYNRILEQKSKILRDRFENPSLLQVLPEYSHRLCQVGGHSDFLPGQVFKEPGRRGHPVSPGVFRGKETLKSPTARSPTVEDPFAPPAGPGTGSFCPPGFAPRGGIGVSTVPHRASQGRF